MKVEVGTGVGTALRSCSKSSRLGRGRERDGGRLRKYQVRFLFTPKLASPVVGDPMSWFAGDRPS